VNIEKHFDTDLELSWMYKLGILSGNEDLIEAYLNVGAVYCLPLVNERCHTKAKEAGQDITYAVTYERQVLEALTPKEVEQLRQYVKANP
jgi:hypothetical protein